MEDVGNSIKNQRVSKLAAEYTIYKAGMFISRYYVPVLTFVGLVENTLAFLVSMMSRRKGLLELEVCIYQRPLIYLFKVFGIYVVLNREFKAQVDHLAARCPGIAPVRCPEQLGTIENANKAPQTIQGSEMTRTEELKKC